MKLLALRLYKVTRKCARCKLSTPAAAESCRHCAELSQTELEALLAARQAQQRELAALGMRLTRAGMLLAGIVVLYVLVFRQW